MKDLLRMQEKALLRRYLGAIKPLLRLYYGAIKALLRPQEKARETPVKKGINY
jgi:hypothetical protein